MRSIIRETFAPMATKPCESMRGSWTASAQSNPFWSAGEELEAAQRQVSPEFIASHREGRAQHPPLCRVADAKVVGAHHGAGHSRRAAGRAARLGRLLRSRRTLSAALVGAHDGDSRAGCGSQAHSGGFSASRARNSCRRRYARRGVFLSHWRRAGSGRLCLWHRLRAASRQDRRPRQQLRDRGQKDGGLRLLHRYACRSRPRRSSSPTTAMPSFLPPTWWRRRSTIRKRCRSLSPPTRGSPSSVADAAMAMAAENPIARKSLAENGVALVAAVAWKRPLPGSTPSPPST